MTWRSTGTLAATLTAILFALPQAAAAQTPAEAQAMEELQRIEATLQPLNEQAMEDEGLQRQRDEATSALVEAMMEADPQIMQRMQRLEAMMQEMMAAQQAGDAAKIAALNQEAQELQPRIVQAQAHALSKEEVTNRIDAFQASLERRMLEIDPDSRQLIERRRQLQQQLTSG